MRRVITFEGFDGGEILLNQKQKCRLLRTKPLIVDSIDASPSHSHALDITQHRTGLNVNCRPQRHRRSLSFFLCYFVLVVVSINIHKCIETFNPDINSFFCLLFCSSDQSYFQGLITHVECVCGKYI